jgi:nitrate reductase gamma subunit
VHGAGLAALAGLMALVGRRRLRQRMRRGA